jgi:hypothetical protein
MGELLVLVVVVGDDPLPCPGERAQREPGDYFFR